MNNVNFRKMPSVKTKTLCDLPHFYLIPNAGGDKKALYYN